MVETSPGPFLIHEEKGRILPGEKKCLNVSFTASCSCEKAVRELRVSHSHSISEVHDAREKDRFFDDVKCNTRINECTQHFRFPHREGPA